MDINKAPINNNTKDLFKNKKLIIRGVAQKLTCQIDEEGYGILVAVHSAIPKSSDEYDIKYLLALLNTSLFNWFHLVKFYTARIPKGSLRYPISFLSQLPIKKINLSEQKHIIVCADKILAITKKGDYFQNESKQVKVRQHERQIDQMVYDLYGLTKKEIEIVEKLVKE